MHGRNIGGVAAGGRGGSTHIGDTGRGGRLGEWWVGGSIKKLADQENIGKLAL